MNDDRRPVFEQDRWFYRAVITLLGCCGAGSVIAIAILAARGIDSPDGLIAVAAGSVGALAGLFK